MPMPIKPKTIRLVMANRHTIEVPRQTFGQHADGIGAVAEAGKGEATVAVRREALPCLG